MVNRTHRQTFGLSNRTPRHSSARNLLGILNDILDFSKIEADRLELEHEPFSLREVLEAVTLADVAGGRLPASVRALTAEPSAWEPH